MFCRYSAFGKTALSLQENDDLDIQNDVKTENRMPFELIIIYTMINLFRYNAHGCELMKSLDLP